MNQIKSKPLINHPEVNTSTFLRLFCFPYAGGNSYYFRSWINYFPKTIEIFPIEIPGRGTKIKYKPYRRIEPLVKAIALEILPYLDKPFAFFGHSMGALVSFELARFIRRQHNLEPVHLFVSGRRAPQTKDLRSPIHHLPEADFLQELRQLDGTPEEVLNNQELMSLLIPILRADFSILESYIYSEGVPLNCPFSVFGGLQDPEVSIEQLEAWQVQTSKSFNLKMSPGNHFFINSHKPFISELRRQLNVYS